MLLQCLVKGLRDHATPLLVSSCILKVRWQFKKSSLLHWRHLKCATSKPSEGSMRINSTSLLVPSAFLEVLMAVQKE